MKPVIEIIITPTGEVQIDAVGFTGPDCEAATRALEAALGVTTSKVRKPEFNQRQKAQLRQDLGR